MSNPTYSGCRLSHLAARLLPRVIIGLAVALSLSWNATAQETNATTNLGEAKRLLAWASKAKSPSDKLKHLAAAAKHAAAAEKSAANDEDALSANELRILVAVQQGRAEVAAGNGDAKSKSLATSRYAAGLKLSSARTARIHDELNRLPKIIPPSDRPAIEQRAGLRAEYLQSQLMECAILEAMGDLAEGDQRKKHWSEAADGFGAIYKKYRTRLASMYARVYQSRCLRKSGQYAAAQSLLGELLALPADAKELQRVASLAQTEQMELWLDPGVAKHRHAAAVGEAWMKEAKSRGDTAQETKLRAYVESATAGRKPEG